MSKPKGIVDWLAKDSPMAKAKEAERAAIVAWLRERANAMAILRSMSATYRSDAYYEAADAIERGEHHK